MYVLASDRTVGQIAAAAPRAAGIASMAGKGVLLNVGGLDESFKWAFDLDLFLRLAGRGQMKFVDQTLAEFRWHAEIPQQDRSVPRGDRQSLRHLAPVCSCHRARPMERTGTAVLTAIAS